jgi:hypothetical protein
MGSVVTQVKENPVLVQQIESHCAGSYHHVDDIVSKGVSYDKSGLRTGLILSKCIIL